VDYERVKKTGREEPIGVERHLYMETTQGNSLCSYLYAKPAKTLFLFIFYVSSSTKSKEQESRTGSAREEEVSAGESNW
jgi:hypothetical protein